MNSTSNLFPTFLHACFTSPGKQWQRQVGQPELPRTPWRSHMEWLTKEVLCSPYIFRDKRIFLVSFSIMTFIDIPVNDWLGHCLICLKKTQWALFFWQCKASTWANAVFMQFSSGAYFLWLFGNFMAPNKCACAEVRGEAQLRLCLCWLGSTVQFANCIKPAHTTCYHKHRAIIVALVGRSTHKQKSQKSHFPCMLCVASLLEIFFIYCRLIWESKCKFNVTEKDSYQ